MDKMKGEKYTCKQCDKPYIAKRYDQVTCGKKKCIDKRRIEVSRRWREDNIKFT